MGRICWVMLLAVVPFLGQTMPATVPAAAPGRGRQPDSLIVSGVDRSKYKVEGNIAYDKYPATILDMIYPVGMVKRDPSGKKYPGVIMFHGGGWIRTSKSTMSTFYDRYLAHGFVVCNAEYRLGDKTGTFSPVEAEAPAAVEDALVAAKWFWEHAEEYNVDKTRVVATGASAGGHLALMVGMATPEAKLGPTSPADFKIAAIVNGYGPTDVADLLQRRVSWAVQWLPPEMADRDDWAKRLSPMTYVRKDVPPVIVVQGSRDTTVPVEENQRLVEALKKAGAEAEMHVVQGAGHGFTGANWPDAEKAMFDFLEGKGIIGKGAAMGTSTRRRMRLRLGL